MFYFCAKTTTTLVFLPFLIYVWCSRFGFSYATEIEIDPTTGDQPPKETTPRLVTATFVNQLPRTTVNLYWTGSSSTTGDDDTFTTTGLQLFYGPIEPGGGNRVVEGYENQIFVLTKAGTYERLGEFVTTSSGAKSTSQTFILTKDDANKFQDSFPPDPFESKEREDQSQRCRSISKASSSKNRFFERCEACSRVEGCGYSLVRARSWTSASDAGDWCFASHTLATVNNPRECQELSDIKEARTKTVDAWLNAATFLLVHGEEEESGQSQRMAFRYLEQAMERAKQMMLEEKKGKNSVLAAKKANAALLEQSAKLNAVFDELDALELLSQSRHPKLAAIHPDMPMVPRRTVKEAMEYIARGEPVIITNTFDSTFNPVTHKWTLDYMSRNVFGHTGGGGDGGEVPKFNVAADVVTQCCQYFEPQGKAKANGYPYPFAPTTHLYRDSFDEFVKTIRKASRQAYNVGANSTNLLSLSPKRTLHYLHEIVMNSKGEVVVAGGPAPQPLVEDLDAVTAQMKRLANLQPFFGGFANAKVWLGQKDIVMPIHYDSIDNLYIMSWGRKKAIVGEPGQLDSLYRYPNGHPLAGSSRVNLTNPDLKRYGQFQKAKLREVVVGPGDVLYLPAWWWHQFEQPFEDTAALNLWSKDRERAPDASLRDRRIREHLLADRLEDAVVQHFDSSSAAGAVLQALAKEEEEDDDDEEDHPNNDDADNDKVGQKQQKKKAVAATRKALLLAAEAWQTRVARLPGEEDHPKKMLERPKKLVQEYLQQTHTHLFVNVEKNWSPGEPWDLSQIATLPRDLRNRCEPASESSPFMSLCL